MNLRLRGRRGTVTGAGAAALTAAAVLMAPAAAAAPGDEMEDAVQAVQEQAAGQAQEQAGDVFGSMPKVDMGDRLPDDLQQDLQNLRDVPASERAQELQQIVQSGLSGDYGDEVERWTERIGGLLSSLPQDLRQDMQSVVGQEPEEARADVRQIIEGAVDGEYGEDVERWADRLRETAQRWDLPRAIQGAPAETPGDMMDSMRGDVMEQIPDDVLQRIPGDVLGEMQNRLQSGD